MNKKIYNLLKSFNMLNEEIERCFDICPGLSIVDYDKAEECIKVLIKCGYPQNDVGLLLAVNPSIIMYNPSILEKKLMALGNDVENALKDDPFAI